MRKVLVFIAAIFLFFSCEEVIDVDLPTSEPRLVVDALIGFNTSNGDPITVGEVRLTLTAPFFDEEVPPAENAIVTITDEQTGEIFSLVETEPGVFSTGFPELQFDRDYTLTIQYDGQVFTAVERMNPSPVIDNAVQGDGFLFDEEEETEVIITFTDIPGQRNNYLFSFGFDNFLVIDDEFFQDSEITFSYFYEDVEPGDLLPITLFGIDDEFATYTELVLTQSGEDGGGGPFAVPPATIKGNIINTTNNDNFPFGYFAISEFDARFITVSE